MHVALIIAVAIAAWFLVSVAAALLIGPALKWPGQQQGGSDD